MSNALEGFEGTIGENAFTRQEYYRIHANNDKLDVPIDELSLVNTITRITARTESEMAWRARAACIGPQAVYFFAPSHRSERQERKVEREELAKSICEVCPVTEPCLGEALENQEKEGIWGGTTEKERRQKLGLYIRAKKSL